MQDLTEARGQAHSLQAQLVQKDAKVEENAALVSSYCVYLLSLQEASSLNRGEIRLILYIRLEHGD